MQHIWIILQEEYYRYFLIFIFWRACPENHPKKRRLFVVKNIKNLNRRKPNLYVRMVHVESLLKISQNSLSKNYYILHFFFFPKRPINIFVYIIYIFLHTSFCKWFVNATENQTYPVEFPGSRIQNACIMVASIT